MGDSVFLGDGSSIVDFHGRSITSTSVAGIHRQRDPTGVALGTSIPARYIIMKGLSLPVAFAHLNDIPNICNQLPALYTNKHAGMPF